MNLPVVPGGLYCPGIVMDDPLLGLFDGVLDTVSVVNLKEVNSVAIVDGGPMSYVLGCNNVGFVLRWSTFADDVLPISPLVSVDVNGFVVVVC